ncbi:MAG: ATP-dependent zinc protease [Gammaproteobacteria bacterium]|jgi:hypothetical protein
MNDLLVFGWREWVQLPELGLPPMKAKVDTGARTSAIHAFELRPFEDNGVQCVEFLLHPFQKDTETVVSCTAKVVDKRKVTDSGGHSEDRWVIETLLAVGAHSWPIELTLTARDNMRFRMLIGRTALRHHALVDSSSSYLVGRKPRK